MSKTTHSQCNVTSGEISPRALGRFDLAKYANAVKILENFLIYQLGGGLFRPGSMFCVEVKSSAAKCRLIPFQYSVTQAYVIEMGNLYFRFCANNGQVVNTGTPEEIVTVYPTADLFNVHYSQDADTMYLTHNTYFSQKLQRTDATHFTIADVPFVRGPFLDKNLTKNTLTPSAATGNVTITAHASVWGTGNSYINGPDCADFVTNGGNTYKCLVNHVSGTFATDLSNGYWVSLGTGDIPAIFYAGHVKSLWRIKSGVVKILTVTNSYTATAAVQAEPSGVAGDLGTTSAETDWAEGAFSGYRGYPATCTFHEQRLIYGNTTYQPQNFWASFIGAYDNFNTGSSTADDNAFTFKIAAGQVNAIRFIASGPSGIEIGTSGGTFSNASSTQTTLTGTNPNVHNDTFYGVSSILPKRLSSYLYYISSNLYQIFELLYDWLTNREKCNDMTLLADHVLRDGSGATDIAKSQSPNDRLWIVRSDGQIAVLTRNANQDVMGWSRIVAGSDAVGVGIYESVAIISKDGTDDQVWVIVKRNINGSVKRYIEYFSSEFFTNYWDPVRVDCALTYDSPKTISAATKAKPVVITATSHGYSNGDEVKIDNVVGMTNLNTNVYIVTNKSTHTFELYDAQGNKIDGTAFSAYISGGQVRKMNTTFSGLSHLEGEDVTVMADGGVPAGQQIYTVSSGAITLKSKAAVVHIGLPYTGTMQMLKLSDGSQSTGQTKTRRIYQITLRVFQSLGCQVGQDINHMQPVYFASPNNPPLGHAPDLFTGDFDAYPDTAWARDAEIIIQQTQPLPLLVLSVITRSEVEERA